MDTHIFAYATAQILPQARCGKVEEKLLKVVPKEFKVDVHHWLLLHGRYTCTARKPSPRGACIIEDLCEYKEKQNIKRIQLNGIYYDNKQSISPNVV